MCVGEMCVGRRVREHEAVAVERGDRRVQRASGDAQIDAAARIAQFRIAFAAEAPGGGAFQKLRQAAQLGPERAARAHHLAHHVGGQAGSGLRPRPVHHEQRNLGAVIEAPRQIVLLQPVVAERAGDLGILDAQAHGGIGQRTVDAGRGGVGDAAEDERLVMVGEAQHRAVAPFDAPATAQRRGVARGGQGQRARGGTGTKGHGHGLPSRTSTSGMLGASPASKAAMETTRCSQSKRTATSKRQRAETTAPSAGGSASSTVPVP